MEFSLLLAKQIAAIFIMIFVGFSAVKLKMLKSSDCATIAKLTMYVITPFMIVNSCQMEYSNQKLAEFAVGIALSLVIKLLYIAFAALIHKAKPLVNTEKASLIYSNAGNMLIPVVGALIGSEGVFFVCSFIIGQSIFFWTHGVWVMGGKDQIKLKKILTNPNLIAIVVGVALFVTGFMLPAIPKNAVSQISATIGPICMFVIGMIIAGSDLKKVFANKRAYFTAFGRLIAFPTLTILCFWAIGAGNWEPRWKAVLTVIVLCFSAPTASNVAQTATVFKSDAELASVINIMTVLFCIVTIPLMAYIYQLLCGVV